MQMDRTPGIYRRDSLPDGTAPKLRHNSSPRLYKGRHSKAVQELHLLFLCRLSLWLSNLVSQEETVWLFSAYHQVPIPSRSLLPQQCQQIANQQLPS